MLRIVCVYLVTTSKVVTKYGLCIDFQPNSTILEASIYSSCAKLVNEPKTYFPNFIPNTQLPAFIEVINL